MANNMYAKGYADGYRAGLEKGQNKVSESLVRDDLIKVYGMMCIALHDKGYSDDEIGDLCETIQSMWIDEYEETLEKIKNGERPMKFDEKVLEITGVDLVQVFGLEKPVE